ncbi:U3 small nucleolar RNA-associated protein 14 [Diplonema papillatum]|nr:U3 small nucleolar RNA-associated protein 14 [Diplonema papillatum]
MPGKAKKSGKGAGKGGKGGGKGKGKGGKATDTNGKKKKGAGPKRLKKVDDVSLTSGEDSDPAPIIEDDESIDDEMAFGGSDDELKAMFDSAVSSRKPQPPQQKQKVLRKKGKPAPKAQGGGGDDDDSLSDRIYASDDEVSQSDYTSSGSGEDVDGAPMADLADVMGGKIDRLASKKLAKRHAKVAETRAEGEFEASGLRAVEAPSLADLVAKTLGGKAAEGADGIDRVGAELGRKLKALEKRSKSAQVVEKPEDTVVAQARERIVTAEGVERDLSKWNPSIRANRMKSFAQFPLPEGDTQEKPSTATVGDRTKASTDMEKEISNLLTSAGLRSEEEKEKRSAEAQAADFVKLKGDVYALLGPGRDDANTTVGRLKTVLAAEHDKRRRVKKIKSKTYRRMQRREKEKEKDKRLELLALVDPEAALKKKKEEMLQIRAKERMSMRHKNKSQWIKHVKAMAKWDPATRAAVENQNKIHQQLMTKVDEAAEDSTYNRGDNSDSDSGSDADAKQIDTLLSENGSKSALWKLRDEIKQSGDEDGAKKGVWGMKFMQRHKEKDKDELLRMVDALEDDIDLYRSGQEPTGDAPAEPAVTDLSGETHAPAAKPAKAGVKRVGKMAFSGEEAAARAPQYKDVRTSVATDDVEGEDPAAAKPKKKSAAAAARVSTASTPADLGVSLPAEAAAVLPPAMDQPRSQLKRALVAELLARKRLKKLASAAASAPNGESSETAATPKPSAPARLPGKKRKTPGSDGEAPPKAEKHVSFGAVEEARLDEGEEPVKKKAKKAAAKKAKKGVLENAEGDVMDQDYLIARAFAADTLAADFQKEKDADVDKEVAAVDANDVLPGWGEWGGKDPTLNEKSKKRLAKLEVERQAAVSEVRKRRKDAKLKNVIINENADAVDEKYRISKVPFPYRSAEQFQATLSTPLGSDWNTESRTRAHMRPKVKTKSAAIITPIEKDQGTRKAPSTKRRKMRKAAAESDSD